MTPRKIEFGKARARMARRSVIVFSLGFAACGMRSSLDEPTSASNGDAGLPGVGGTSAPSGVGGHAATGGTTLTATAPGSGGTSTGGRPSTGPQGGSGGSSSGSGGRSSGGSGGNSSGGRTSGGSGGNGSGGLSGSGGSGSGGRSGTGGTSAALRDASVAADARPDANTMPGAPVIDPNSGYATIPAGTVVLRGFVTSSAGGSGSSIGLTCTSDTFCASGTVGASTTYSSWANAGFNVNQPLAGGSGSTSSLALVGSTISISYVNHAGSGLEMQLWDSVSSSYWCYSLPPSSSPTTTTIPFSKLNSRCWDGTGTAFVSGTSITMVQMVVPGSATVSTPFDYCFLGLTVQ